MQVWDAFSIKTEDRGYQVKDDAIWVFLNFKKVGVFKDRTSANKAIDELIKNAPVDLSDFSSYLKE